MEGQGFLSPSSPPSEVNDIAYLNEMVDYAYFCECTIAMKAILTERRF
ncbi:hypothetical protein [[Eubacterium] cellulosolvens]